MASEWQEYSAEIKDVLKLEGSPVAVTYAWEGPRPANVEKPAGVKARKHRVCDAFLCARRGEVVDITKETSGCPGGTRYLGFPQEQTEESVKALQDFLVNGEKLFCSIATFYRSASLIEKPPVGLAPHVILCPLELADKQPDLVLFICNAEQGSRLVTLDMYSTGIPPRIQMAGATCSQAVAYPIVTGELNVSLMDYTSRHIKGYTPSDLIVSIPWHRFLGVMRSIPGCTAGRAKMDIPDSFRKILGPEEARRLEQGGL